jgi:hypothetical protein
LLVEGISWLAQRFPTDVNLGFLELSRYFSFKKLLNYSYEAESTPYQIHYFSQDTVAPGIEPETFETVGWNSDN